MTEKSTLPITYTTPAVQGKNEEQRVFSTHQSQHRSDPSFPEMASAWRWRTTSWLLKRDTKVAHALNTSSYNPETTA